MPRPSAAAASRPSAPGSGTCVPLLEPLLVVPPEVVVVLPPEEEPVQVWCPQPQ